MKITEDILKELGANNLHGMESSYSGLGWYMKDCILEWDDVRELMCIVVPDSFYNVTTAVSEVEELKMLYKLLGGEDLK